MRPMNGMIEENRWIDGVDNAMAGYVEVISNREATKQEVAEQFEIMRKGLYKLVAEMNVIAFVDRSLSNP